jgi:hypothetical protein
MVVLVLHFEKAVNHSILSLCRSAVKMFLKEENQGKF